MFDAYGTLFDVHSVAAHAETLAPGNGAALSRIWRTKQLDYTWLQSLMAPQQRREDFAAITAHALDYAIAALALPLHADARRQLLDAYLQLTPFPDAADALARLALHPRWILSNGTLDMLTPLVRNSGLGTLIDGILS
ncbi:MAG: HAD-IA family hydrolase, partial [Burkholderiales bacterium]